jgi:hypothetical protein
VSSINKIERIIIIEVRIFPSTSTRDKIPFFVGAYTLSPSKIMNRSLTLNFNRNVMTMALCRLNGRLGTTYEQIVNQHARIVQRSKASAAASPQVVLKNGANASKVVEDTEWNNAKSFDEMPGLRSVPVLGTSWAMLPVVGTVTFLRVT